MHSWTTRRLFPAMGLIPIEREQARKAMAALEVAASVLTRGDVLTHLPRGHPVARRPAAQGAHRRRPAGADVRGADRARRPRRHRPDPAHRSPRAAPVPSRRGPLRRAARPQRLRRVESAPPSDADRRPDGGHPPAVAPVGERRLRQPRAAARARRHRERVPGPHARRRRRHVRAGGPLRRRRRRAASSTTAGSAASAGSAAASNPTGPCASRPRSTSPSSTNHRSSAHDRASLRARSCSTVARSLVHL